MRRRAAVAGTAGPGPERVRRGRAAVAGGAPAGDPRDPRYPRDARHARNRRRLAASGTYLRGRWIHEHEREKVCSTSASPYQLLQLMNTIYGALRSVKMYLILRTRARGFFFIYN